MPSGNLTFRGEKAMAYLNTEPDKEFNFTVRATFGSFTKDEMGASAHFNIVGIDPASNDETAKQVIETIRDSVL
jgi:hypothetical protein